MRRVVRIGALATAALLWLPLTPSAQADPDPAMPSQEQVDAAKATADRKAADVAAIKAALVVANTRLQETAQQAEIAAEAWNGARWRLSEARKATRAAKAEVAAADAEREAQRAGIAHLVTQSYQEGTALNGMTAFLGAEGPAGVMQRYGVVQSAGESMQAEYDRYTAVATLAKLARKKATEAEHEQERLAQQARELRDQAAAAAAAASNAAASIAAERTKLLEELAKAQKISLALATERQQALEAKAKAEAEAAAKAKAKAEAAKAAKAKKAAAAAQDDTDDDLADTTSGGGGWGDPGQPAASGTSQGAAKAIAFARQQLGEPYRWGAAGPNAWDCSGLTMMAWRQGGVSLPHYSAAQYARSKHISMGDLRPGDLVFWGGSPSSIHHVALYIGDGLILHAPRTGQPVQVNSMFYWVPPNFFGRP